MEPERPIEKLLRVFAKKRRDQAGAPWEMPPRTRQLLRSEVARRAAKDEESFFAMLLALFRRRAAFAVCVVAVGFIGAWLLRNNLDGRKIHSIAQKTGGENSRKEIPETPPAVAPPPASVPEEFVRSREASVPVRRPEAKSPSVESNLGIAARNIQQQAALAGVTQSKENADAGRQAETIAHSGSEPGFPVTMSDKMSEPARETNVPAPGEPAALSRESRVTNFEIAAADGLNRRTAVTGRDQSFAEGASIRYYRLQASGEKQESDASTRVQEKLKDARPNSLMSDAASSPPNVLFSFAVEQSDGKVRIVDGDGSVYTGVAQAGIPPGATVVTANSSAAPAENVRDKKETAESTARDYYFRVSGTNQSLNRSIIFTGRFVAATNGARVDTNGAAFGGATSALSKSQPTPAPRIEGTLMMDDNTKMEIRAVPTGP